MSEEHQTTWPEAFKEALIAFTKRPTTPLTVFYWIPIAGVFATLVFVAMSVWAPPLQYLVPWILGFDALMVLATLMIVAAIIWWKKAPELQLGQVGPRQLVDIRAQELLSQGDSYGNEYKRATTSVIRVELSPEQIDALVGGIAARQGGAPLLPIGMTTPQLQIPSFEVEDASDGTDADAEDENP